ncbi:zinc-binding dehydrogenase family protein [Actinidia rufa]|uniref:Zinc-binding dehydrogenase family protein n=1 Tax=Actinidia rufa TaxID=165716 RepID=A0A7J0DZG7_9ERIC|nr:zinc-binding dehydrogenase family protein [Actinidia rufa]
MGEVEEVRNKQVVLRDYIHGFPKESDMYITESSICLKAPQGSNGVVVKNLYLSCDPYMQLLMKITQGHGAPFTPGSVITGYGVAKVLDSGHPNLKTGDFVWGTTGWEEYSLIKNPESLFKIENTDVPLSYYTGILGKYAWFDCLCWFLRYLCSETRRVCVRICSFRSSWPACRAVCKIDGCYVVGSAGSKQKGELTILFVFISTKVHLLKNKLGFDEAFNYKEEQDLDAALKRYFPEGIDVYFENVGGKMLDAVLLNMRHHGRIAVCGAVSQYNAEQPEGVTNLMCLTYKQVRMEGFVVFDYYPNYSKFLDMVLPHIRDGKIVYVEDVTTGLESGPSALLQLFSGRNVGKQLVAIAHE